MVKRRMDSGITLLSVIVLLMAGSISIAWAQVPDFNGTWNTVTSKGKKIVVTLETVRRAEVSGTYARNGITGSYQPPSQSVTAFVNVAIITAEPARQTISTIRGRVVDNVLRFRWQEDGGHGAGKFTLASDGLSFTGTFSLTDLPDDTSGGTWNGTRAPNFAGVWQTKAGDKIQFPELLFQKDGSRFVGRLYANRPDYGVIKDGILDGNTLRFTIWRPRPSIVPLGPQLPDEYLGTGELVMDKDGKSFKGTILGGTTSGTLIAR